MPEVGPINIRKCARCGLDHTGLQFRKLTYPLEVRGATLTHFALCPTNLEPIIMWIEEGP